MGDDKKHKAAVIGWPIGHSLSPRLHNYWLAHYSLEGTYDALEVKPEELEATLRSLAKQGYAGCNLTIPHKEAALRMLDKVDPLAKSVGAVNTVIVRDGKLFGTNTDVYGFRKNLAEHASFEKDKAVIVGAGGAARAICKALLDEGFESVVLVNRTLETAEILAKHFGKRFSAVPWEKRAKALMETDLLVNTTSLGLAGHTDLDLDLSYLPRRAVVSDIVYTPPMTRLLEEADKRGNPIVGGIGMLIYQAVPAFEAWFGRKPEVTQALKHYLLESAA